MAEVALPASRTHRTTPDRVGLPVVLLVGFAAAVAVRCAVGGDEVARSRPAGLLFAALLAGLAALGAGPRVPGVPRCAAGRRGAAGSRRAVGIGLAGVLGAVVLLLPALHAAPAVDRLGGGARPGLLGWAAVVTVVATAEEVFLRGTLVRLLSGYGSVVAIGVPALAFAALHVPLYGWGAAPLDLAVGVWLGALRLATGSVGAPAVAHVLADWAGWVLG